MKDRGQQGFLLVEILIAGLILTASIAATMYLFRMGYDYLEKADRSNVLSSKLIQVASFFRSVDLGKESGEEDLGGGVTMTWEARLLGQARPTRGGGEFAILSMHELLLYKVNFSLAYQGTSREYEIDVFKSNPLSAPGAGAP
jgi:hypothetical protein